MDVRSLRTDGKVYVNYHRAARAVMAEAMDCWKRFGALPVDVKRRFQYTADEAQSGNGYELKMEPGATLDLKENFHLRLSAREHLLESARQVGAPEALALVEATLKIPELIKPMLLQFAARVEQEFRVQGFVDDVEAAIPEVIIRLLHYFGDVNPLDEIAKPHIDKGGFTLHLWESDSGVEQLSFDRTRWTPIPVSHEESVIFPASGLQYLLKNEVRALCHRVMATTNSARNGRYSAVAFVDFRGNAHYDKMRHGRMQDRPPGFNYDMPWEEYRELFILPKQ